MKLLFGLRPFEFEDFFSGIHDKNIDLSNLDYLSAVKRLIDTNIRHFEITADLAYVLPGLITENTIAQLKKVKKEYNISFSVHLPLWSIEPASPNRFIQKASIECLIHSINLFKSLTPTSWVLHATGALIAEFSRLKLPQMAYSVMMSQFATLAQKSIEHILDHTKIDSRTIAIENVEFPFQFMESCLEELDLGICFDTGHLLAGYSGKWDFMEFYERYKDRIIEIHFHDGEYPRIDHRPLGKHQLPVKKFLQNLLHDNFSGPVVFELSYKEALESLSYIKEIVPEVFD